MPIADPYQAALRDALIGAVETKLVRQRRRARVRRVAVAMVAVAALVAVAITITLPDDRADASIEISTRDGSVFVQLLDLENRPDQIVGALRNAGIDAEVEPVPVGPSNVGRFVGASSTQDKALVIISDNRFSFTSFSVPENFQGILRLSLGRRAEADEPWRTASDATAKGEVLACRTVRGLTPAEATKIVADAPATVNWLPAGGSSLAPGAELLPPYDTWRIVDALAPSDGLVALILTENGQWPYPTEPPQADPNCKGK